MNFSFFVARRYLFSKKSSNAVNIVTRISLACVSVVTAALVIILSAMNGLSGLVESLYNSFHSDIRITVEKGKVFTVDSTKTLAIKNIPGVAWYTEIVDENGLVESNDQQLIVMLRGVDDNYVKYTRFDTVVREGRFDLHPSGQTGAIAGQEIGARLELSEHSEIKVYVPKRDRNLTMDINNLEEEPFNKDLAFVSGLYFVSSDFDGKFVFLPIDAVRKLLDYTNECTSVEIGVKPDQDAEEIIASIQKVLGPGYKVETRYQQNEVLYKTLKSEKMWTFLILIFVLVIATFNTIGSLTLLIIEKKKDIGVLWSMGADRKMIRKIFFTEGLLISLTGTLAGIGLGLLTCWLQTTFGFLRFGEGFVVSYYPITVEAIDMVYILLSVTAIGLLAAWYPVSVYTRKYQHIRFNG
ncbi:MAG TPA: FtsX-like permease family protein [Bacteroidia bacterium]|nr:FtsX-like permease family protein [Bacteroidia bacterium]